MDIDANEDEPSHGPGTKAVEVPLPPDEESPIEEQMNDVDTNNSVSSEHPNLGGANSRLGMPRDAQLNEGAQVPDGPPIPDGPGSSPGPANDKENQRSPGVPASDPESGA
ncbi:hypothetical protein F9Z43_00940 [Pseudomonas monteilii]|uniref:Uncharacterized protein n=1 Tax=Pseudomonas monteilii TaxID=76759 RepID=A0A7X3EY92_9PSED|nr:MULTISPECIES: hypothetical protein [Pseudomonas]MCA4076828.1 hypothetical protein [Pseudomonas kurunegalensis]MVF47941.1 hypothetical protein [Pseudomonas monteilii]